MSDQPTLTTVPSALLKLALVDLAAVEKAASIYTVDMLAWHDPCGSKCHVCLAGAVIANTFKWSPTVLFRWDSIPSAPNSWALVALNLFAQGRVADALKRMKVVNAGVNDRVVTPYGTNPGKFRGGLTTLAADLSVKGL